MFLFPFTWNNKKHMLQQEAPAITLFFFFFLISFQETGSAAVRDFPCLSVMCVKWEGCLSGCLYFRGICVHALADGGF